MLIVTLTEYIVVIQIKSRNIEDVVMGIVEGINKMGTRPEWYMEIWKVHSIQVLSETTLKKNILSDINKRTRFSC